MFNSIPQHGCALALGGRCLLRSFEMTYSILLAVAAVAAQAGVAQSAPNAAQAQAQGYAQAQQALAGNGAAQAMVLPPAAMQYAPATPIAAPVRANAILRVGTEIPLRLTQELTTKGKKLRVGDRFHLETSEPVMVQGVNVIPVGSPAVGEITDVRNKGMWGKSGHLAARILYVTVNGRQIRLSGAFDDKGVAGGVGAVAVSAIVFLPAGFFMTGTSAKIPAGSIIKSFVDEDVPLSMPVAAQAPMQVGAPAAPMQVQAPAASAPPAAPATPAGEQH
jgi:hypothetical protein